MKASWTMSSASAADCTHCRAKSNNPGATSEKQLFQSSWLARFCMTSSRSLSSRRRQGMILSRPPKFFFFIAWLAVAAARGGDVDLQKAVGSLIAAEKAYAKLAGEKGFRAASISVFADDAVIFTPNAVNGKKFWRGTKDDPAITWRPTFASIPRSRDLGHTTRPSASWKGRDAQKPETAGQFGTMWQKNKENPPKGHLDL